MTDVPVQLIVAAFQEENAADAALKELKAAKKERLIGIQNAAILRKDAKGKLHIRETADMGGGKGAAIGGLVGAAVGVVTGGIGLALGAAGALVGGLAAKLSDGGFSDARLKALGDSLQPETSAIVAVIEHKWVAEVSRALAETGADLMTMNIAADLKAQLQAGREVSYSAIDTGDTVMAERIAGDEEGVDASEIVMSDRGTVATRMRASEEGVAGERFTATDKRSSYEIGITGDEGTAYLGASEDDAGVQLTAAAAAPLPAPQDADAPEMAALDASEVAPGSGLVEEPSDEDDDGRGQGTAA